MAPSSKYFRIHPTTFHQLYPQSPGLTRNFHNPPCLHSGLCNHGYRHIFTNTRLISQHFPAQDPPLVPSGLQVHMMTASGPWVVIPTCFCTDRCRPTSAPTPWTWFLYSTNRALKDIISVSALHSVFPLEEKPPCRQNFAPPIHTLQSLHRVWHGENLTKHLLKE